ncbi:MAG: energy transducer TonB [Planctomycetota bacterium]
MEARLPKHILLIGILVSVVLHATVLLPALIAIMNSQDIGPGKLLARFEPDDFLPPEKTEPEDQVQLGIEESEASTLTWIGHDEYQEHMAALAETEQAAFTTTPPGAQPVEPTELVEPIEPMDSVAEPEPPAETAEPQEPTTDPLEELESWLKATEFGEGPAEGEPTDPNARQRSVEEMLTQLEEMLNQPTSQQQAQQQPAEPQPAQQPQPPVPPAPSAEPTDETGDPAEQESDATSTVNVPLDNIKLGKPLAAHGLRIKPRKPVFTVLTMLTAAPANPLAELRFRRDGKPQRVRLVESSGDKRIDEAILNSLYRWRASGERLKKLKKNETISITIRIVLH